jgi:hypothetical protein
MKYSVANERLCHVFRCMEELAECIQLMDPSEALDNMLCTQCYPAQVLLAFACLDNSFRQMKACGGELSRSEGRGSV